MKKIKFIAMAMLALLTAQCKKNEPEPEPKVMVPISGSVSFGGGSKTEITTTGYVTPKSGDMIYIYHAGDYVGSLTCTPGTGQAFTCSGVIEQSCLGEACTFMYLGSENSVNGESTTISFADQTGISANSGKISGIDKFHVGSCKANVSDEGTVSLSMRTKISIAYFQLKDQNGSAMANKDITISGVSATATIKKTDGTLKGKPGDITVHTDANGCFYMALVPQSDAATFTFTSANANGTDVFPYGIGECCFYSEQGNVSKPLPVQMNSIVTPDLLPGVFSVSNTTYVKFSGGNLFCTRSGSEGSYTYEFGLENNQYEYHTRYGVMHQNSASQYVEPTSFPGLKYEENTSGLFQWVSPNAQGQTSDILASYGAFSALSQALCVGNSSDVVDFGKAYGDGTTWSTLTSDEMQFLLAHHDKKWSTVCEVKGLVLAPDEWTGSIADSYDVSSWLAAEQSGLVFLPAAGNFNVENSSMVFNVSTGGYGWSQSPNSESMAYIMDFSSGGAAVSPTDRYFAMSVRLVQRFEWPEVEPTFVDLGLPSGTLWADVNVGATAKTGIRSYGKYYSWGETAAYLEPMTDYGSWTGTVNANYIKGNIKEHCSNTYWKWNGTSKYNSTMLMTDEDDIASQKYGAGSHIPTATQWTELFNSAYTTWTWDATNFGHIVTSKSDLTKSIFIPNASFYNDQTLDDGEQGRYWCKNYGTEGGSGTNNVYINKNNGYKYPSSLQFRGYGMTIRAVKPKPIEYVEIAGLKWTKQNLAISDSGKKSWKGGNATAVKVPGSDEDVINGDYFQWATYAGYCGNETDADKGLLIYNSFTSTKCGDGSDAFTYKSGKQFIESSTPYYSGSSYTKYTSGDVNLEDSDDVAKIILGGSWRMPTATEFNTMYNATYWAWDATDKGYYVYTPNPSTDAGRCNDGTGSYNKSNALLFFPAAGYGSNNYPNLVGNYGLYWSSNLNSDDPPFKASNLYFHSSGVTPQDGGGRYSGLPVRPVSN